jgi:hypothetical protein
MEALSVAEDAPFRSVGQCLNIIHEVEATDICKVSDTLIGQGSVSTHPERKRPHERHAEAAMVFALLRRELDAHAWDVLRAYYAARDLAEKDRACQRVAVQVMAIIHRAYYDLEWVTDVVREWADGVPSAKPTSEAWADALDKTPATLRQMRGGTDGYPALVTERKDGTVQGIYYAAMDRARHILRDNGLIQRG